MNELNSERGSVELDSTSPSCLVESPVDSDSRINDRLEDPFEPPGDTPLIEEDPPEHFLNRLRLILWGPHQSVIAGILFAALILMTIFFSYRWYVENGLIDIDQATPFRAEFKVDINSAELGEIVVLPGIGTKLAHAIVEHRTASGGFESLDELCEVHGIGEKTLESLKPHLLPINPNALNRQSITE